MKKNYVGFSLIELMIVVAIIGILAVSSFPSYQQYTKRARFTEIISATEPYKIAIALALQTGIPIKEINSGTNGIPEHAKSTTNIANIQVKNGIITATGTQSVDMKTYILKPDAEGNNWSIDGSCLLAGLCHA